MELLAISGSLKAASTNTAVVEALQAIAPPGVTIHVYRGLAALPHFNPDLEADLPPPVAQLRSAIGSAHGLIICSPEYAHGIPGSMKNALDWLVPSVEFPDIAVALINAAPHAHHAQDQLREVLTMMNGHICDAASIAVPLQGRRLAPGELAEDPQLAGPLREALETFCTDIAARGAGRWRHEDTRSSLSPL